MKKCLILLSVITIIVSIRGIFTYACTAGMATPELIHNNPNIIVIENVEATAYKCSCNPVNNHLGVLLRYQYYRKNRDRREDRKEDRVRCGSSIETGGPVHVFADIHRAVFGYQVWL